MHVKMHASYGFFRAGKYLPATAGIGDLSWCSTPTLLGSLGKLCGSLPFEIPSSFAQDEERTKVGLSLSGLSDIQYLEVLM